MSLACDVYTLGMPCNYAPGHRGGSILYVVMIIDQCSEEKVCLWNWYTCVVDPSPPVLNSYDRISEPIAELSLGRVSNMQKLT